MVRVRLSTLGGALFLFFFLADDSKYMKVLSEYIF